MDVYHNSKENDATKGFCLMANLTARLFLILTVLELLMNRDYTAMHFWVLFSHYYYHFHNLAEE